MTLHSGALRTHPDHGASHIAPGEPFQWLANGISDFRHTPTVGLMYGLMVAVMGWLAFTLGNHPYFIAAAATGFLLLGPILGAGLVETSRAISNGETPTFDTSLRGLGPHRGDLEQFALVLLVLAAAWFLVSGWVLNATMGPIAPNVELSLWDSALAMMSSGQWLAWAIIGGVLAVLSFAVSVITVPAILDRDMGASEAIRTSLRAVARHPLACAEWALIIVLLTAIGIATALVGLVVIYPVLGHASWHAYQALRD